MKNILFLVGSPKIKKSTSEAIIDYIIEGINVKNIDTEIEKINILSAIEKEPLKLIDAVNKADTIVLSFPTYIDTLPTHVIRALLLIDEYADKYKERNFMAIANCGFPEPLHNDNVMKIYKNYCNHNNFRWIGGISIGGGGVLSGKSLTEFGGMTKKLNKILDSVTELILEQNDEIFDVIQIQIVPTKIYTIIGNIGLVRQSKKDGVFEKMNDTPYIED